MPFAAAASSHPVTAQATGEILGQILERLGRFPDLVLLFATSGHAGALEDVAAAVETVLSPTLLVGAVTGARTARLMLWAGRIGPVAPLRLTDADVRGGWSASFKPQGLIVLAHPEGFALQRWLETIEVDEPGLPVVGTVAAGGPLLLDRERHHDGVVGAVIGRGATLSTVTSPVGRPIGRPLVVTGAEGRMIYQLDGGTAFERLQALARDQVPAGDLYLINTGLHLGSAHPSGPFPILQVLGVDRSNGALAIEGDWAVAGERTGRLVQFFVRDQPWAEQAVAGVLAGVDPNAAVLFGDIADGLTGGWPGASCEGAGVMGPAGRSSRLHRLTVEVATFTDMNNS